MSTHFLYKNIFLNLGVNINASLKLIIETIRKKQIPVWTAFVDKFHLNIFLLNGIDVSML